MNLAFKYIIYFITAIVLLTGCRATQQEPVENFSSLLETEQITVYMPSEIRMEDGKVAEIVGDILFQTEDQDVISEIITIFKDWDMEANQVPSEEILNLHCDIYICFEGAMTLAISSRGTINCYGKIEEKPYYLPEDFVKFIKSQISSID